MDGKVSGYQIQSMFSHLFLFKKIIIQIINLQLSHLHHQIASNSF
jgi:hypothetical protein